MSYLSSHATLGLILSGLNFPTGTLEVPINFVPRGSLWSQPLRGVP